MGGHGRHAGGHALLLRPGIRLGLQGGILSGEAIAVPARLHLGAAGLEAGLMGVAQRQPGGDRQPRHGKRGDQKAKLQARDHGTTPRARRARSHRTQRSA